MGQEILAEIFERVGIKANNARVDQVFQLVKVGFIIALILLGIILLVIIGISVDFFTNSPQAINLPENYLKLNPTEIANYTAAVNTYKELSTASTTRATTLFETIGTKALIPILTSVLGYIFGTYSKKEGQEDSG